MNKFSFRTIKMWLPFAFLATALCGLTYLGVQQSLRQSANDPQIGMAEDTATAISQGAFASSTVPQGTVNIAASLSPYVVLYDQSGMPIWGNGQLDSQLPYLPNGVFAYTKMAGEDRFTWQPRPGVRSAVVLVRVSNPAAQVGFVMAGRSLREVERREDQLTFITGGAWIVSLVGTLGLCVVL